MESKACMMGWDSVTQGIITFTNNDGQVINIIKEHGKITKNKLLTECDVFINGAKPNQWAAQNSAMWAKCINTSLSKAARQWVLAYHNNYEVLPTGATHKIVMVLFCIKSWCSWQHKILQQHMPHFAKTFVNSPNIPSPVVEMLMK